MTDSSRALALAAATITLATLAGGCDAGSRRNRPALHPSSDAEFAAETRLLTKPVGLAALQEDAVVRIVGPMMTCTGTLVEGDLILTAHHCLVERGAKGEFTTKLLDPASLDVQLGGDYFAWSDVSVKNIVAPPCGEAGGAGDIAILVLTRPLVGLIPMTPRFEQPPKVGEDVQPIGFGRCALSSDGIRRKERAGGSIRALTQETLFLDASICPGDSGGPVLAKGTRDVVGVVSQSAMDHDENTRGPSVMTRVDAYRSVFAHARWIADGMSPAEIPPLECAAH